MVARPETVIAIITPQQPYCLRVRMEAGLLDLGVRPWASDLGQ